MCKKPLLSVVVPVHNASKTLNRCVSSILDQTLNELEIILVDDGSTDEGGVLCDELGKENERIIVKHQDNQGPLAARVTGSKLATGKYISFVDSDDWIENNMFQDLCKEMADTDMLAAGVIRHAADGRVQDYLFNPYPDGIYSMKDKDFIENAFFLKKHTQKSGMDGALLSVPFSKIFKRDIVLKIIDKLNLYIRESEDWMFNSIYMLRCEKIKLSSSCYYHYVTNLESISHTINLNYLHQQNEVYNIMRDNIAKHTYENVLLKQVQKRIMASVLYTGVKMGFYDEALLPVYRFPNNRILEGKKIVLFGAGMVGRNYLIDWYRKNIDVILWIDNVVSQTEMFGKKTLPVKEILKYVFDYVVCAITDQKAAKLMKKQLLDLGVNENKIIWSMPIYLFKEFFSQ